MSKFYDILKATRDNLATYVASFGVPVVLRRRAVWTQTDSLPLIVVAPGDTEVVAGLDFDDSIYWQYPIIINMIYPDDRHNDLELDAQEYLDLREAIRYWIYFQLIPQVPDVWDVDTITQSSGLISTKASQGTVPFALADQKSTFSSTIWVVKYKTRENRRSGPLT